MMKMKKKKKKIKRFLKKLFVFDVTPLNGVIFIAFLAIIFFYVNHSVIATAMPLSLMGYKFLNFIGIDIIGILNDPELTASIQKSILESPTLILIIGYAIGAVITELLQGEYKPEGPKNFKNTMMYVIGGLLVGFGVQGIYGANIGEVYGAISMLSLSGWFIIPFICLGIFLARPLYRKFTEKKQK